MLARRQCFYADNLTDAITNDALRSGIWSVNIRPVDRLLNQKRHNINSAFLRFGQIFHRAKGGFGDGNIVNFANNADDGRDTGSGFGRFDNADNFASVVAQGKSMRGQIDDFHNFVLFCADIMSLRRELTFELSHAINYTARGLPALAGRGIAASSFLIKKLLDIQTAFLAAPRFPFWS